jgi:hypothetical protein
MAKDSALTRAQKHAVAALIIRAAADTAGAFEEERASFPECDALADVSYEQITAQMGAWLKALPGPDWDGRLPL